MNKPKWWQHNLLSLSLSLSLYIYIIKSKLIYYFCWLRGNENSLEPGSLCNPYKCWCNGVGVADWNISDSIVTTVVSCSLSTDGDSWNSERFDSCFQRCSGVSDRGVWSNLFQSSSQVPANNWMNTVCFSNSYLLQDKCQWRASTEIPYHTTSAYGFQ